MNQPNSIAPPQINLADYFQRFSTQVLWHFTGYEKTPEEAYGILNLILETKTLKRGANTGKVIMPNGNERWGFQHACMSDIPFRDLRIHILRYGQFGIAFHKRAAITLGHFNPVLYVHRDNFMFVEADALLKKIEGAVDSGSELQINLQKYLLTIGSLIKRGDLTGGVEMNAGLDNSQDNNFYYEREWRTIFDWKFDDSVIAAIMIPQEYRVAFHEKWKDRFVNSSIISSQMIETL